MSHTVDLSALVTNLFVEDSCKIGSDLIVVLPVLDICFNVAEHFCNLLVCTAVKRTLERAEGR